MKEEVFKIQRYSVGHRVDKQMLLSLEEIFKQYNPEVKIELSAECNNSIVYKFDGIEECFEYFSKAPHRIVELNIKAVFGEKYDCNEITLTFDNTVSACTEVRFKFDNSDDYLVLKNKIELCMKNFKLNYRILSVLPLMPTILTAIFVAIYIYTNVNDIIYPRSVQNCIWITWIFGSIITGTFAPFTMIKRNVFPCTEFRIGQNEIIEEKNEKKRNFIICTVCIGTVLGLIINYLSGILF